MCKTEGDEENKIEGSTTKRTNYKRGKGSAANINYKLQAAYYKKTILSIFAELKARRYTPSKSAQNMHKVL